jgi:uroporphyrinogen III methyltransferase / synthase
MLNRILFGHRVLITRTYTEEYRALKESGAELVLFPTLQIIPPESFDCLDATIDKLQDYNWLIITSPNALTFFEQRLKKKGRGLEELARMSIGAVGSRTAEALKEHGLRVRYVPEKFSGEGLIAGFAQAAGIEGGMEALNILLPRAENARDVFPDRIREMGGRIDTPTAYKTALVQYDTGEIERLLFQKPMSISTFTSGAIFNSFLDIAGKDGIELLQNTTIAVLGPVTRNAVEEAGLVADIVPERATIAAMVHEIIEWASSVTG